MPKSTASDLTVSNQLCQTCGPPKKTMALSFSLMVLDISARRLKLAVMQ